MLGGHGILAGESEEFRPRTRRRDCDVIPTWLKLLCAACITVSAASGSPQEQDVVDLRISSYEAIWQTVNEHHYDSTFGGLDWTAIHDKYYDLVKHAEDEAGFLAIAKRMLGELGLSHYSVFRAEQDGPSGSPTTGTVGLETRLLDGKVVITSIRDGYPAAKAGLRAGYIVEDIDDVPVELIMSDSEKKALPNADERRKQSDMVRAIRDHLLGEPGTSVSLSFLDESDSLHQTTMVRTERPGKTILDKSLPPFFVEFQAKRIADNIGYVNFSVFLPPVDERFEQAIDDMLDVRGLVLDIRGSPGGMHEVGEAIASKLVQEETLFSVFRYRDRTEEVVVRPNGKTYTGPVVVLIDGQNASASERFAACLQSIGRAVVIGERSRGAVGPSDVIELPNGTSLLYLVAQSLTPDGIVLEGRGVIPDIVVRLDREALLNGKDTQLDRAVEYIKSGQ
jgi:carboxyl-terminal processing protease